MNIRTVKFDELTRDEIVTWSAIQQVDPLWASPFFRPEFTQAVASVRKTVEVAVLEDAGRPVGFFPFERRAWNRGAPVGTKLSDYHGVITAPGVDVDPIDLMRACGLSSWSFDHLVSHQTAFDHFTSRHAESPMIDLSKGYDDFESALSNHFRSHFRRKVRKLEREVGPIRFEFDVRDSSILSTLIDWKIQQYRRTKTLNILGFTWVRELLECTLQYCSPEFAAVMPALWAGDTLLAVGYLLRSGNMLHSWFVAYDRNFAGYSTGILHQMKTFETASGFGITCLDMGKGGEDYKKQFATGSIRIAEGVIDPIALRASARSAWWGIRNRLQVSPLRKILKYPARKVSDVRGWLALR